MPLDQPELELGAKGTAATAVRFADEVRAAGLHADLDAVIGFARALTLIDLAASDDVHAAGAAFFVDRPEERPIYDAVFDRFWRRTRSPAEMPEISHGGADQTQEQQPIAGDERRSGGDSITGPGEGGERESLEPAGDDDGTARDETAAASAMAYSAVEALRTKSFEQMTPDEMRDAARMVDALRPRLERRRTRRYQLHHRGPVLAPRAMMRRSLGTAGDSLEWIWRRRRTHPRPIVAICDISGSMEQHSRFALRFIHALSHADVRTESFVFGTRLTRITPHLRHRDADEALREVASSVEDWAGGTQIGQALYVFNRHWARRVLRTSAVVVIVSDGWDRGNPQVVAEEMALLARRCHRIIWLNPLAATAGYEPRTAGMAAAYPYIDDFLPIANVASLERLGELLGRASDAPIRRSTPAHRHVAVPGSAG